MIAALIILCLIPFVSAGLGPLLMSEETTDLVQPNEYRLPEYDPCPE